MTIETGREVKDSTMRFVQDTMNLKNIVRENANTNEFLFNGRNGKISDKVTKEYSMDYLLSDRVRKAFKDNLIYIHDFSSYAAGNHNCLTLDLAEVLKDGFVTNNADIREPSSISSAMQLTAVILQCQSNLQFGGIAVGTIDIDLAPYVEKSFHRYLKEGFQYIEGYSEEESNTIINRNNYKYREKKSDYFSDSEKKVLFFAWDKTVKETRQGAEALIHNLNSLQSRASDQLPFTSINYGTDITPCGRLITKSILQATIDGVGKNHLTPIFPVQVFQYMKKINDKEGTPNYDLFRLAIKCTSLRMFPNYANTTASYFNKPTCKQEIFNTMGCRTQIADDRFGIQGNQGRGNISPVTINLAKLGIKYGTCLGKRNEPDLEGFWKSLNEVLDITTEALVDRFEYQGKQPAKSAPFMYQNQLMKGKKLNEDEPVREVLKHGTLAYGLIGLSNCMSALFGKHQFEDKKVWEFGYQIYKYVEKYKVDMSEKYNLNFSVYSTPAESCCYTIYNKLIDEYGEIENVIDHGYLTNSFHCPVWYPISAEDKIDKEAPFHEISRGGAITYVELDGAAKENHMAIEQLINYAMDKDISYFAINIPIDTCRDCHYQGVIDHECPRCGGEDIMRLRRVTGYLSGDYKASFNKGKQDEVEDRYRHVKGNILFE